ENMLPRQEHFEFVLKKITSEKKRIPVIIFCDPGVDDALMLLQMLNQKKYVIAGIIPVRGNASSRACLENTLALSEYIGRTDIKIYPGRNEK
ncbi:nucleoside hydrolase, partial [Klebsiella pneumoniae]|uniref:nucleoside hydrolase n=1 Tax=Klebsiella pneumoniae TaxID=573 RepID=UPI003B97DAC6